MCGIFGFVGNKYLDSGQDLIAMKESLNHRGPDCFDFFSSIIESDYEINLGHVRLSIIDTSDAGNQPMISHNGRYTIIFNGEIYNFLEIKKEIEEEFPSIIWKSNSDTEVLLVGIELFGLKHCVTKLVGMFAFVLWDSKLKCITLVRDRIGEKPLYYGYQNDQLIFASELKAFEVNSKFEKIINQDAAVGFLLKSCIPKFISIYKNVYKVKPGSILEFNIEDIKARSTPAEAVYWSLKDIVLESERTPYKGTYDEALKELETLLIRSVKCQAISDVPLGAFLSGGIDSSLVCALYKKHVKNELHTFTIGMPEPGVNEAIFAQKVADSIETLHETKYLSINEVVDRIEEIIDYWDEPFADSSQIPTFFVSELAKKNITVSLSGDGADEFAYGYVDYPIYRKFNKAIFIPFAALNKVIKSLFDFIPPLKRSAILRKILNFSYLLSLLKTSKNLNEIHAKWRNKFRDTQLPLKNVFLDRQNIFLSGENYGFDYAGYYDGLAYLPDDILVKVDRAAMAVSLESRAPFLDHRVIEFLITLPTDFKYHKNTSKRILKDILYKYVPKEIVDRPKLGFSVPLTHWLRNEIKDWAYAIINNIPESSLFWDKSLILKIWDEHQSELQDHTEKLWNIIVLERFFQKRAISFN